MSNAPKSPAPGTEPAKPQRHVTPDAEKDKARKWFKHAKTVGDSKNYDYAIELYVNGLGLWPDAVEEGLRLLRVVATARKLNGGKPAGFLEATKRSTTGKDPIKNLANAYYLFGMDPAALGHMDSILTNASKLKMDGVVHWISPVIVEALTKEKKLPERRYADLCDAMRAASDLSLAFNDSKTAVEILQAALRVAQIWSGHYPDSANAQKAFADASSQQTIVKGRFGSSESFVESVRDAEKQSDLRDKDSQLQLQSVDRMADLVQKARKEWASQPDVPAKLLNLVDLLTKKEEDEPENEAINLLEAEYEARQNYAMKSKADDLRMRQWARSIRRVAAKLKAEPDNEDIKKIYHKHLHRQVRGEIEIYRQRMEQYPSDIRIRFELAKRLFKAKLYDEAIPLFQQTQNEGRHRTESRLHLGRCFIEKGFAAQAVSILSTAMETLENKMDDTAKDLNYWLGRALEADGQIPEAKKAYGQLIQLDYNYRDARARLEAIQSAGRSG